MILEEEREGVSYKTMCKLKPFSFMKLAWCRPIVLDILHYNVMNVLFNVIKYIDYKEYVNI